MKPVIENTVGLTFYFDYTPSILASLVSLPILLALAVWIPAHHYRSTKKAPLRDRLAQQ